eukprot:scaffold173012_cov20-Prasinocladus_malaysianus.AAC.1
MDEKVKETSLNGANCILTDCPMLSAGSIGSGRAKLELADWPMTLRRGRGGPPAELAVAPETTVTATPPSASLSTEVVWATAPTPP